jgi:ParB family transcriptional regulator, chromosome partitioning protein
MSDEKKPRTFTDLLNEHHVDDMLEGETIEDIKLTEIKPNPFQPRRVFDEEKISELAESIKEYGIFQPIILKKVKFGYILVSGERRYRAAQIVGLKTIPSIIRQYEESKVAEIALAENLQRENLTPIEEAEAYKMIINNLQITQNELARKIGKSRSHVTNILGLLNLPLEVQNFLLTNQISMGHARVLSKLENEKQVIKLAKMIIEKSLSVRQIEELATKEVRTKQIKRTNQRKYKDEEVKLFSLFHNKIKIDDKKIVIYASDNGVEEIIERLLKK